MWAGEEDVGGADLPVFCTSGARCRSATIWAVPGFCLPLRHSVSFLFGLKTFNTLPSSLPTPPPPPALIPTPCTSPPTPLAWPKEASAPVNSLTRILFALRRRKRRASAVKSGKVSVRLSSLYPSVPLHGERAHGPTALQVTFSLREGVIKSWQQNSSPYLISLNAFTRSDVFFFFSPFL